MKQIFGSTHKTFSTSKLIARMKEVIPEKQALLKQIRKEHGSKLVQEITLDQTLGGMRSMMGLFHDISKLDAQEGIRFRGYSIPECDKLLPKANEDGAT